jgi:transcriptional regulator with PAS, ATPase and Fis domain
MSESVPEPRPRRLARHFRWQALFASAPEPLFLLDRRRRLLYVNPAWEKLTGVSAAEAAALVARRPRPSAPGDAWPEVLQHALTPPAEALEGAPAQVRRLLPGVEGRQWWEVAFLPLRREGGGFFLLGRIRVLPASPAAASRAPLPEGLANLRQQAVGRYTLAAWEASEAPAVRRLVAQARLAAGVSVPVLLVGEAGVGKQALARAIHAQGPAREQAFAALDCRRLPPAFVAAVLFAEEGPGRSGPLGAVYLKHLEELPREVQLRLCDWLTDPAEHPGRPRLMAGSRVAPGEAVRSGRLLEDLACVLGTLVLELPPLRERPADLPALVEQLLARANAEAAVRVTALLPDAWEVLRAYRWPGNIAELYAALRVAQGRCQGERIAAADLPAAVRQAVRLAQTPGGVPEKPLPLDHLLEQAERRLIELALRRAGGNKTKAAQALGIWRPRLLRRMEALKIADTEPKGQEGGSNATNLD